MPAPLRSFFAAVCLALCAASPEALAASTVRTPPIGFHAAPAPPNLSTKVRFEEPSGNRALDAIEEGAIVVTFENSGKGDAHDVAVVAEWEKAPKGVKLAGRTAVGTVAAGKAVEVKIPISADESVPDQSLRLRLTFPEGAGFDADPVALAFEARAYQPPKLAVADFGIDDSSGNGQVEPGEVVEVTCRVQNVGTGDAAGVAARVEIGENVFLAAGARPDHDLGNLGPGEHRDIKFSFYTNKRVQSGEALPIAVRLKEGRGRFEAKEPLRIAVNAPQRRADEVTVEAAPKTQPGKIELAGGLSVDVDQDVPLGKAKNPNGVAVVIGNRSYKLPKVPAVEFADRDAAVVKEYLVRTLGYDPANILYFSDATLANFNQVFGGKGAFEGQLFNFVKAGKSDVFVYYSGHGAPDLKTDPKRPNAYFVPSDADPDYIAQGGYPLDLFWENLARVPARSFTVVLDTCFSGNSDKGLIVSGVSPALLQVTAEIRGPAGSVVMTSSAPDQVSSWYPEKKHGLFTYWWLKGIGGAADLDGDGAVTVTELGAYLKENVTYEAQRRGRKQNPVISGPEGAVLVRLK